MQWFNSDLLKGHLFYARECVQQLLKQLNREGHSVVNQLCFYSEGENSQKKDFIESVNQDLQDLCSYL